MNFKLIDTDWLDSKIKELESTEPSTTLDVIHDVGVLSGLRMVKNQLQEIKSENHGEELDPRSQQNR